MFISHLVTRTHVRKTSLRCFVSSARSVAMCQQTRSRRWWSLCIGLVYGNAVLTGLPVYLSRRLQSVLNAAAGLIFGSRRSDHTSDAPISLHWLRILQRIQFKVAVLTYKVLYGCVAQW